MSVRKMFWALAIVGGLASGFTAAASAEASTLNFQMTGDYQYSWTMDSDQTPDFLLPGQVLEIHNPSPDIATVIFFDATFQGGGIRLLGPASTLADLTGPQLFSGTEAAPHFAPGIFGFTGDTKKGVPANETLTISAVVAATPAPAALPLFASAIGGLGFVGWRRKRSAVL